MSSRPLRRLLLAGLVLVATVAACAEDDQTDATVAAPAPATGTADEGEATELDCLGDPVADDGAVVAPVEGIPRPDEILDLRGQSRVEIPIRDNVYDIRNFRVDPCTEIVFVNRGANRHNVVPAADGVFEKITEDALDTGPQTLVVATPGDYPFYCSLHGVPGRGQTGYLIVGDVA
jgi:plastocyanin